MMRNTGEPLIRHVRGYLAAIAAAAKRPDGRARRGAIRRVTSVARQYKAPAYALLMSALLAGCSQHRATDNAVDDGIVKADKAAVDYAVTKTVTPARVSYTDTPIFGTEVVSSHEFTLPLALAGKRVVVKDTMTLSQIKDFLTAHGIPTAVGDPLEARTEQGQAAATGAPATGAASRPVSVPFGAQGQSATTPAAATEADMLAQLGIAGLATSSQTIGSTARTAPIAALIDCNGDATECVRNVETAFGVTASMTDGVLHFDYFEERTFYVNAPSSSMKQTTDFSGNSVGSGGSASMSGTPTTGGTTGGSNGGGGAGASGGGSGSTNVTSTTTVDIWPEIKDQVKEMLPLRARYAVSPSLRSVFVKADHATMLRCEKYFDRLNADLDPRIAVDVSVIKVSLTDTANYDFDLNLLFQQAAQMGGALWSVGGIAPSVIGATGTVGVQIVNANSQFNTSQAVLRAVSSVGRIVDYKTGSVVTQNNRPANVKLVTNQDIIKSVQLNVYGNNTGVSNTTITPSTVVYGYTMSVWPRVVGHNRISVAIASLDSDLANLVTVTVGGNQLQEATLTEGQSNNEVTLGLNETLVLSGFEETKASRTRSGMGDPSNWGLGGTNDASLTKTRVIMVVRPKLLRSPDASGNGSPS